MTEILLSAPVSTRRRLALVVRALVALVRLEPAVRRRPLPRLCADAGIVFGGFSVPNEPARSVPRHVEEAWWAVEVALRLWPWARKRPCLRRGLLLGRQIAYLRPTLALEVTALQPLEVHAFLVARGNRLDLGRLETPTAPTPATS